MRSGIFSPIPKGSGSSLLHQILARHIEGYNTYTYSPLLEFAPFFLPFLFSPKNASLIHTAPDHAVFFCGKSRPLIITFHNYVLDDYMRAYSSLRQRVHYGLDLPIWTRLSVTRARALTAVSRFTAGLVQKEMGICEPIRVIYNGIDVRKFRPIKKPSSPKNTIRVLFSGNPTRRKGFQWLPEIQKALNRRIEILYTLGPGRYRMTRHAKELKSVGHVPHHAMPGLYNSVDILLMPTVREGFGLSIAEAMACGLPIVASNCSAIPELVDDGKGGFLCPVGNVDAFAEKINLLADSPGLRKEMGEYNREKVERKFTVQRMVREYRALFEEVLE